ncbi:MAG: OmpA family protein [Ignavibacteria bacterium]|nr:OmpA family protein [Ignavibacteria bacterium]
MKLFTMVVLLVTLTFVSNNVNAQFKDFGLKGGVQFNGVMPATEFEDDNGISLSSWLARAFLRFELADFLNAEVGAGYGNIRGDEFNYILNKKGTGEYSTNIIPVDFRLNFTPMNFESWNPYIYAGIGAVNYNVGVKPFVVSPLTVDADGWAALIPVGIGTEIKISDDILLDLSAGLNYSLTENLNYYKIVDLNDGYFNLGVGIVFAGEGCDTDKDNDGLTRCEEKELGTDPRNADTDGDGLRDGDEIKKYNTDPLNADSDKDGLKDGEEVLNFKTNPNKGDSDNDGLSDFDEVKTHKTDPNKADTDNDGLNDGDEILKHKTSPFKADTDGDGLTDSEEVNKYKTNPLVADTDGDGLKDGEEVMKYKTDPLKVDTDGGTVNDGVEVNRGTDPLDPKDDVVKINVPIVLEGITFATNKFNITPESESVLNGALKTLKTYSDIDVEISGHTDSDASNEYNQKLSQSRAEAVKDWLVSKGISVLRITAVGYGEEHPRVANDTPDNKRLNRRIEFKRVK